MNRSILDAIAYVKAEAPPGDPAEAVDVPAGDFPVLKSLGGGLVAAYVVDEGDRLSYVQEKDLGSAGIDAARLHAIAVANLAKLAEGRVVIRPSGPIWALFLDGNFESSLILLDDLWDDALCEYHGGDPVIALPARDVLCFCAASSEEGVAGLRAVVEPLWPGGDHLVSRELFRRRDGVWTSYDGKLC